MHFNQNVSIEQHVATIFSSFDVCIEVYQFIIFLTHRHVVTFLSDKAAAISSFRNLSAFRHASLGSMRKV